MVSSTTTNLFKYDGQKRGIRKSPLHTTNVSSIVSIDSTVDLVDSRNDLSKLPPKKRIDDLSKVETTEVAKKNVDSSSNPTCTSTCTSRISTSNVEVGFGIRMISTGTSTSNTTNINADTDRSNFRENFKDANNKNCVSTKKNINFVLTSCPIPELILQLDPVPIDISDHDKNNKYYLSTTVIINHVALKENNLITLCDIPDPPDSPHQTSLLEPVQDIPVPPKSIISNLVENIKYTPVDIINTYEIPVTVDVVTYNNNNADNNNNIADESADTSSLTINDTVFQPGNDDVDVNDEDNNNDVVADSTSSSESDDNTDAIFADPNGEYNYNVIASLPVHSINSNNNSNHNTYTDVSVEFYEGNYNDDASFVDDNNDTTNYADTSSPTITDEEYSVFEPANDNVDDTNDGMNKDDDIMVINSMSSLPTMIDGEFAVFRSAIRADDINSALMFGDSNITSNNNDGYLVNENDEVSDNTDDDVSNDNDGSDNTNDNVNNNNDGSDNPEQ